MKKKKFLLTALIILICIAAIGIITLCGANAYVKRIGGNIITPTEATELENVDCVLILGCGVKENGEPSDMLSDRLKQGIELYKQGVAPKIIMSGDHGKKEYDEVNTMKQIAISDGVPSSDVFMDHAGFSTYESLYRAKEIFNVEKVIIVTQKYHLYRSLYIAKKLGIEAYGIPADYRTYPGQSIRDFREVIARCKDSAKCVFMPKPTYLGDTIPVSGNGDSTNDK